MTNKRVKCATGAVLGLCAVFAVEAAATPFELRVTTFENPWQDLSAAVADSACGAAATVELDVGKTDQTVIGFGTCMSELSHEALWLLTEDARAKVMDELFSSDGGAFTVIRTPIGASDFAKDFYSYCETPGDFEMKTFSTDHDDATLIPLIREVQKRVPSDVLRVWGSPWCPPRWMKTNRNAVCRPAEVNDLPEEGRIFEGEDGFVCDDAHMKAYALYFRKYVDSYRAKGIPLWMVMPQNEFNSAQNFPSCTWSVGQLARFIGKHLGPALEGSGVELYFGTMERPNPNMLNAVLERPAYAKYVTGAGFQWAGKDALPRVRAKHPELTYVMTEQECGDGQNDWKHALHCWDLMRHYFENGVSAYDYWNLALKKDGLSHWGWRQNSLVVVDETTRTCVFTPEYYMLKHLSHFVRRGAKRLVTDGSYAETLAFVNPDGSVVVMLANKEATPKQVEVRLGGKCRCVTLPASSVATLTGRVPNVADEYVVTMDYKYAVPGFTYTGKAASVEVWPTQNLAQRWGARPMKEDGTAEGARHFTFQSMLRDRYARFLAFDAQHRPLPISGDEIRLDTCDFGQMRKLGDETWEEKLRRLDWWRHDRFGMFIHFGLYALPARHEWLKSKDRMSEESYQRYFDNFNPVGLDAREWARAAKKAGMKYVVLTTKHHEGFCLFDSKFTDYKSTKTPFGRDIVREYVDALRTEGLKVGFYYSVIDWHHPDYTLDRTHPRRMGERWDPVVMTKEVVDRFNEGRDIARYRTYLHNQVTELLTNYGKIDIIWFDFTPGGAHYGEGKTRDDWDSAGLVALARRLQPGIIIDNRLDLKDYEDGQDFLTPEQCRTEEPPTFGGREWPWETCQTFSGSWGYYRDEKTWKSRFQILEQLIQTVSCNGNLIMNVGPTGRGEFDNRAKERLSDYGEWMGRCGEAIYGCGRAPAELLEKRIPNTLYTYNAEKNILYVHFLCWTTGPIPVPFADRVKYAEFLHDRSEVEMDAVGRLLIPLDKPPVEIPVVAFTL